MKDFAVVLFKDENTVALVSTLWLENDGDSNETYCYWPGHRQSTKARKHEIPDKQTWGKHEIRLLRVTDNYEKARNIAKKAEETSNVDSDEERPRKRQPPSRFSSSDDDMESDTPESVRRSPRKTQGKPKELAMPLLKTPTCNWRDVPGPSHPIVTPLQSQSASRTPVTTPKSRPESTCTYFQTQVLLKLQALEEGQKKIMAAFNAMGEKPKPSSLESADLCEPFSEPLNTVEDFKALEGRLKDPDFKSRMITYLSLVGGSKLAQTGRRVMQKLGTNQLWSEFNILGRKGKRSLKATKFFPVIVGACMKIHEGTTETEVEEAIADYVKRTPFLPGGNKYKKVPTVPVVDVGNDDIEGNGDVHMKD